ncbi:LpqB family beta-propeller domain-containing protein [Microbacterium sp. HD4P20]|uniref:GerMN domain-containing protein n=1 Tax=Microbacterium sp. HD4P20 TaxID=2864874 RepID=UPI0020A2AE49|nr:GerMN domain-containing protein [Microbacterium sp. HD4P20]MCP2637484.1 LpqB family beta-propeller domain-containing protein [Microbacterium sp. HD4P20]
MSHGILAILLACCAVVLSACAGFATGGPINYGLGNDEVDDEAQNVAFLPDRPQPGASPAQIVEGFINAGTGPGVDGDWARAREFLAPSFQDDWAPEAGVTVDVFATRGYTETEEGAVDFTLDAVASVDDRGAYERAELSARTLPFTLARQADGEWRITDAPDGVVLDRDRFPSVFHRFSVMYFDPTFEYLVPDVRWFPTTNAEASITHALVNQPPSEWLEASVVTAFPENVTAVPAVLMDDRVAQVELSVEALAAPQNVLDRMLAQLEASLATAGVMDVVMNVDATPVAAEPAETRSTRVPGAPLVLNDEGFGFLTGGEIDPIPGLSQAVVSAAPLAVQVGPDRDLAAARLASGAVARLSAERGDPELVDTRAGLIDPTIDPFGIVWSVPRDQPSALRATLPSGEPVEVADAWPEASAIAAMSISRDGTRIAAAVTAGGRTMLWVAGVVRDDGVPVRLGVPVPLATVGGPALGVTWIDNISVGVLATADDGSIVLEQVVGGPTSSSTAPEAISSIAGGTGVSSLRLRADDGTLFVKRGVTWQPTATGVRVLATQQGAPQ